MSHRHEDMSLLAMLRDMSRRLGLLEKQLAASKHNDIRLGEIVVTTDHATNRVCLENLKTGEVVCIGNEDEDASWSFSGLMSTVLAGDECSPPHVMGRDNVVRQIVLAQRTAPVADVSVVLHLNDDTFTMTAMLPAGQTTWVTPVQIPVTYNTAAWVCLDTYGAADRDLSVYLRFSQIGTGSNTTSET